tara:strand:- start:2097 stop:3989 length:1893 start_codon:yes stop_codon:yes gene_type:complete
MNPADIKVSLPAEKEKEIAAWLCQQIEIALQDRSTQEQRWLIWLNQYEEILAKKDFPWEKSSNISVPVTPIAVETIHAREINASLTIRPYIQIKPKKTGVDRDKCSKIERFLDALTDELDLFDKCSAWFLEKNKMGTAYGKPIWLYNREKIRTDEGYDFKTTDRASLEIICIEDLLFPSNATSLQACSFVAQRIRPTLPDLQAKEKLGLYKNVDKVKDLFDVGYDTKSTGVDLNTEKEKVEGLTRTAPTDLASYRLWEIWFRYDIDNDGYYEPLVGVLEDRTQTFLRVIHQPPAYRQRPFIPLTFMKRTNRIWGKGIAEMSEHLQAATNTVFNQTIDNATEANIKCFKGRKSARKEIGKIYPGKVFWLDDPQTDLMEFSLGEIHQSNFMIHNLLRDYHERRTKVTDYTLGRDSSILKTRATATGTLALLQESGKHFDLIIKQTRQAMQELAYQLIELYQYYDPDKVFRMLNEDGALQDEFGLPEDIKNVREEFSFYAIATSLTVNKEIEKQSNIMLLQQLSAIYEKMFTFINIIYAPQVNMPDDVKRFVMDVVRSYYNIATEIVRSFEKVDVSDYVPELPDIIKAARNGQPAPDMVSQLGALIGGQGEGTITEGPPEASGLAGLFGGGAE